MGKKIHFPRIFFLYTILGCVFIFPGNALSVQCQEFYDSTSENDRIIDCANLLEKGDLYYITDQSLPFTGYCNVYHPSGSLKANRYYDNGLPSGEWVVYYEDGSIKSKGKYLTGLKDSTWLLWYPNGQLKCSGDFLNGLDDGKWMGWYENGRKSYERAFVEGTPDGPWSEWYDNGKQRYTGTYLKGIRLNTWSFYDEKGKLSREELFEEGELARSTMYKNGKKVKPKKAEKKEGFYKNDRLLK